MSEILSSYIYVKKPAENPTISDKVPVLDLFLNTNQENTDISPNTPTGTQSASPNSTTSANYTTDFQEIFKTVQEIKELLKVNKFI